MDLTQRVPRSPYAELDGIPWLPRMIDKGRALAAGTLGEYVYPCPMDDAFLDFYGVAAEAVQAHIATGADDADVARWWRVHARARTPDEVRAFKVQLLDTPPADPERAEYLQSLVDKLAPGRTDIATFAQLIAADEGHPVPTSIG